MSNNYKQNIILSPFQKKEKMLFIETKHTQQGSSQSYHYWFAWGQLSLACSNEQTLKKKKLNKE